MQAAGTGLKANPSLKNPNETQPGQHTLAQGWALKYNKSRSSSNEKPKDFLNRILRRGGEDRHESKPRKCCKGDDGNSTK